MTTTRERGRPARTRLGTASAFSRTWIDPTAPWLSFDPAVAVPADVVAACKVALMLSNPHKEQGCGRDARAPRPIAPPLSGSRHEADAAGGRRTVRLPRGVHKPTGASPGVRFEPRRRRPHLAVGVSPWKTMPHKPSRVGGGSNPPWCSISNRPRRPQPNLYPECSAKKVSACPADELYLVNLGANPRPARGTGLRNHFDCHVPWENRETCSNKKIASLRPIGPG